MLGTVAAAYILTSTENALCMGGKLVTGLLYYNEVSRKTTNGAYYSG